MPDPETLEDADLSERLWRALTQLTYMKVVLLHTDHLSDRQLYTLLVKEILLEKSWPCGRRNAVHLVDAMMGRSKRAVEDFLRFYADEATRDYCAEHCPELVLPERQPLLFDRGRKLAALRAF